ncbi:MAG: hypothetical protein BMS9Abin32_276 [Gammaproteobacteria bacterium]|nr:MAG: hypothetical protein BMS9Abin32_276 [Gammaproteobacteria bacterium]
MKHTGRLKFLALVAALCAAAPAGAQRSYDTDILRETFGYDDASKRAVSLEDLHQGCSARDCIPAIDEPQYVSVADATHMADDDIVLTLSWQGQYRAYPARILDHHEIVNDVIAGTPIAITWCPLCGSAIGVLRNIGGEVTDFGVSGLLYNSSLVFYDRRTETLWDQIEAKGIVGPLTGVELELVPVAMTRWSNWSKAHPDTLVLSADTGFNQDYSADYYGKYRASNRLMFPVAASSDAMHAKSVVYGFEIGDQFLAVTEELLQRNPTYEQEIDGLQVTVVRSADGSVRLTDRASEQEYTPLRLYWFAWYTFHPQTGLLR